MNDIGNDNRGPLDTVDERHVRLLEVQNNSNNAFGTWRNPARLSTIL